MKTAIDTIRNGRFAAIELEDLRQRIVALDCGFTRDMVDALNDDINQLIDADQVRQLMADTLHEMQAELG